MRPCWWMRWGTWKTKSPSQLCIFVISCLAWSDYSDKRPNGEWKATYLSKAHREMLKTLAQESPSLEVYQTWDIVSKITWTGSGPPSRETWMLFGCTAGARARRWWHSRLTSPQVPQKSVPRFFLGLSTAWNPCWRWQPWRAEGRRHTGILRSDRSTMCWNIKLTTVIWVSVRMFSPWDIAISVWLRLDTVWN